jgi:predicted small metal-binding protein
MSLHFDDADPVATCLTGNCGWHTHGDSINDAVLAWAKHVTEKHREQL